MRRSPFLENKDQFMLGAVKTPHSGVGLIPHAEVLQFGKNGFASAPKLLRVSPVHTDKSDCAISAPLGRTAEGLFQKGRKFCRGHLSNAHGEFPMANAARATDVAVDGDVVGRVGKDQVGALIAQKRLVRSFVASVAADQPMTPRPPHIAAA
jgi:hypothetical protein